MSLTDYNVSGGELREAAGWVFERAFRNARGREGQTKSRWPRGNKARTVVAIIWNA
jgi:hypothetical protein